MVANFPRILSLLRQEKGISQRSAAASLGVSQALLSHYENGAREPGFDFLVRAATFYGVTTDYLLGRTISRVVEPTEEDVDADAAPELLARIRSRMILNSAALLFRLLETSSDTQPVDTVSRYLALAVYRMFRYLCMVNSDTLDALLSVPQNAFAELCDVEMKQLELRLKLNVLTMAEGKTDTAGLPKISHTSLEQTDPALAQSMLALLHLSGEQLKENEKN